MSCYVCSVLSLALLPSLCVSMSCLAPSFPSSLQLVSLNLSVCFSCFLFYFDSVLHPHEVKLMVHGLLHSPVRLLSSCVSQVFPLCLDSLCLSCLHFLVCFVVLSLIPWLCVLPVCQFDSQHIPGLSLCSVIPAIKLCFGAYPALSHTAVMSFAPL